MQLPGLLALLLIRPGTWCTVGTVLVRTVCSDCPCPTVGAAGRRAGWYSAWLSLGKKRAPELASNYLFGRPQQDQAVADRPPGLPATHPSKPSNAALQQPLQQPLTALSLVLSPGHRATAGGEEALLVPTYRA